MADEPEDDADDEAAEPAEGKPAPKAPAKTAAPVLVDANVLLAGGGVALVGIGVLCFFLWMVPEAAARETVAACRGLGGYDGVRPALCPPGTSCKLPLAAPDFTAIDNQNRPIKLSSLRGKVVLLNFTASWCGVCKTEKPNIAQMVDDLDESDLVVVTLSSDRSWGNVLLGLIQSLAHDANLPRADASGAVPWNDTLAAYKAALPNGVPFQVWLDPPAEGETIGKITKSWGITAVPETALIDRNGNLRAYFVNKRDWTSPVAQTCLRSVLDE